MRDCLKEMTKHLRTRIAKEGIKARVRILPGSRTGIQVFPVAHDVNFSEAEQAAVRFIAKVNHLALVRGLEIIVDRMTDPHGMEFHLSAEGIEIWKSNVLKFPQGPWQRRRAA